MATGKKCGLTDKGAFARACLAPASKKCAGRKQPDFQNCRRLEIKTCSINIGCKP